MGGLRAMTLACGAIAWVLAVGACGGGNAGSGSGGGDVCSLPKQAGTCEAAIPRFWFNAASGRC
jgi:hypothetical protein